MQLQLPKLPSASLSTSTLTLLCPPRCPVCLQQSPTMHSICNCPHQYCKQCCIQHISISIEQFRKLKCLSHDCDEDFDESSIPFRETNEILKERYQKQKVTSYLQKHPHLRQCASESCRGLVDTSVAEPQCSHCANRYCKNCGALLHEGPCQNNMDETMNSLGFRKCRYCHIYVEKTYGCNYVSCKCGNYFCFICGAPWDVDPCRFATVKKRNIQIRSTLKNLRMIRVTSSNFVVSSLMALTKILLIVFLLTLGGLVLPMIICSIATLVSLLISPLYVIGTVIMRKMARFKKRCIVTIVVIFYPVLSVILTLLLIAFVCSYFLFGSHQKQDIYKEIDAIILNYVFGYLRCLTLLISI